MFSYAVQQEDVDILRQNERIVYAKIELLNAGMQTVNTFEGLIFNDNFSLDGTSAVRRTYNCDIIVSDETFLVGQDKNIWADRYIVVYYGVQHARSKNILWYKLGTFSYVDVGYRFSTTEKHLSITCHDMMADYNGTKRGVIIYDRPNKAAFKCEVGQTYNEILVGLCNTAGIKDYNISGLDGYTIPYDLEFNTDATYYDVWSKMSELYPGRWEFFFDENGGFVWRKLPTGYNEDIVLDDGVIKSLIISEDINNSFQNIFNVTEVWGQELDIVDNDRYASACTGGETEDSDTYNITIEGVSSMDDIDNFTNIGVELSGAFGKNININGLEKIPIMNAAGNAMSETTYVPNMLYVFRYRRTATGQYRTSESDPTYHNFYLLGQFQAHGYYEETNDESPYSIKNLGYKAVRVIENSNLFCDEVCQTQAEYETYKTTAKQDSISLQTMIIPFLEPNQKLRYTPFMTGEVGEWIIQRMSWNTMSGVMSLELFRFNEDYEYVNDRKHGGIKSLSALYVPRPGGAYVGQDIEDLRKDLIVNKIYNDGTSSQISDYSLEGTLEAGDNTISVLARGIRASVNVNDVIEFNEILVWDYPNGHLEKYDGGLDCVEGALEINDTATRKTFMTRHGDNAIIGSYYPIPIPSTASRVTITLQPSTQYVSAQILSYKNGAYTVKKNIGWVAGSYTGNFTAGANQYICINIKENEEGTSRFVIEPTSFIITFSERGEQ